jgi:hypothetical protein
MTLNIQLYYIILYIYILEKKNGSPFKMAPFLRSLADDPLGHPGGLFPSSSKWTGCTTSSWKRVTVVGLIVQR